MEKTKSTIIKIYPYIIIGIFAFVFSMQCANTLWRIGDSDTDSSVFIYVARVILSGGMPYKDVFDHKGPLLYLINVIGLLISERLGIYIVELISAFITFLFIYKIAKLKLNSILSLISVFIITSFLFAFFMGGNYSEEYALPFITISLYIFIDYYINNIISTFRLIVCGFCFGSVCLLRLNMVALWIVMCFGVIIKELKEKRTKELFKFIGWFFVGVGLIVLPIFIWLFAKGAFSEFIDDYLIFNSRYSRFIDNAGTTGKSLRLAAIVDSFISFFNLPLLIISLSVLLFFITKEKRYFDIVYFVYIFLNLFFICYGGRKYSHYGMIILPSLIYPLILLFSELKTRKYDIVLLCVVSYLLAIFAVPEYTKVMHKGFNDFANRNSTFFDKNTVAIVEVINKNTTLEDKIIVFGNGNIIYNLSNRFAASKYSFQFSSKIDNEKIQEFFSELEINKPKLIIFLWDNTGERGRIDNFIEKHAYKKIAEDYNDKTYIIYGR